MEISEWVPTEEIASKLKAEPIERRIEMVRCIYLDADMFRSNLDGKIPADGIAVREIKSVLDRTLSKTGVSARK